MEKTSTSVVRVEALKASAEPTPEEINRLMEAEIAKLRARGGCIKHAKITVGVAREVR